MLLCNVPQYLPHYTVLDHTESHTAEESKDVPVMDLTFITVAATRSEYDLLPGKVIRMTELLKCHVFQAKL
jgi:hypothetical protein